MKQLTLTILAITILTLTLTTSAFAGMDLDLNFHAPTTGDMNSKVSNEIPEIKASYTLEKGIKGLRFWASYEQNAADYYGRKTFIVPMPGLGIGYQLINNDRFSINLDAGIYFPQLGYEHAYKESLNELANQTTAGTGHFDNWKTEAKMGMGVTLGTKFHLTDHLDLNIGARLLRYDYSIHGHNGIAYGEPGAHHWWFGLEQDIYSGYIGLGYSF